MSRFSRPPFDREQDFITTRAFLVGGRQFSPGEQFDKSLVVERRLRQMYDTRQLRQVVPAKAVRRRLRPAAEVTS